LIEQRAYRRRNETTERRECQGKMRRGNEKGGIDDMRGQNITGGGSQSEVGGGPKGKNFGKKPASPTILRVQGAARGKRNGELLMNNVIIEIPVSKLRVPS